jgi:hypothetical protein
LSSAVPVVVECFLSECNPFCKLIIFGFSFSSISNGISVICYGSFGSCYGFSPGISSFSIMIFSFVGCVGCFYSGGSRCNILGSRFNLSFSSCTISMGSSVLFMPFSLNCSSIWFKIGVFERPLHPKFKLWLLGITSPSVSKSSIDIINPFFNLSFFSISSIFSGLISSTFCSSCFWSNVSFTCACCVCSISGSGGGLSFGVSSFNCWLNFIAGSLRICGHAICKRSSDQIVSSSSAEPWFVSCSIISLFC